MLSFHLFHLFWIQFKCSVLNIHYAKGTMRELKAEQARASAFKEPVIAYESVCCVCVCAVHDSAIHNSRDMDANSVSINRQMEKDVVHTQWNTTQP